MTVVLQAQRAAQQQLQRLPGGHAEQLIMREQARRLQQLKPPVPAPELQQQQKPAQRHVQRGGTSVAWYLGEGGLKAAQAWNTSFGSDAVVVAVVDSGVEVSHGAVGASVWVNAGEVAGDGIDNDGNGFVDDVMGWDFGGSCADASCSSCSPGPDPTDLVGWGSHAAGVVAGQPEVAAGTAGLAPGVRVMPLKVADCRAGMQLSEVVTGEVQGSIRQRGSWSGARAAPVMWGSAAVAAFDYAALNGAHIVLAAWQAGQPLDAGGNLTSTNGTAADAAGGVSCIVGPGAAAAVAGLPASGAVGGPGSEVCAAVQQQLFRQALAPLQAAGVLLVTSLAEGPTEGSSGRDTSDTWAADAAAVTSLPCSLACELDNVLCVGLSRAVTGVDSLNESQPPASGAAEYFSVLLGMAAEPAGAPAATGAASSNSSGSSNSSSSSDSNTTRSAASSPVPVNPPLPKKWSNPTPSNSSTSGKPKAGSTANSHTTASDCSSSSSRVPAVQLRAPGGGIRASWAWGSHAVVSGSSAAAAVAAGAAALAWSSLGAAVGAEASAGAFEGLGATVRVLLLGAGAAAGGGEGARELGLPQAVQSAAGYSGPLLLLPSQLPATSTVAAPCSLTYTWHTLRYSGSPFDTSAMFLVARKALLGQALDANADSTGTAALAGSGGGFLGCSGSPFPIQDWEFIGPTALVEMEAFVGVVLPGTYRLAVTCEDKFLLWLQDKWVVMVQQQQAGDGADGSWQADVEFAAAGYYKLRIIIYQPVRAPFDLQWRPPGAAGFSPITSLVSLGRQQPLPAQLQQRLMLAMAADSSVRASKQAQQQQQQQQQQHVNSRSLKGKGQQEAVEAAGPGSSSAFATSASSGSGSRLRRLLSDWGYFFPFPFPFMGPGSSFWGGSGGFVPRVSSRSSSAGGMPGYADGFSSLFGIPDAAGIFAPTPDDSQQPFVAGGSSFDGSSSSSSSRDGAGPASAGSKHTPMAATTTSDHTSGDAHSSVGSAGALPAHTSAARGGSSNAHKQTTPQSSSSSSSSHRASGASADPLPGAFSVAASFLPPQTARVFTPSLAGLQYSHTGVLPGPGLDVAGGQLQQALLGLEDAADGRAGYGVIQGWAHWQQLNAAAAAWLTGLGQSGVGPNGTDSSSGVAGTGGASGEAAQQLRLLQAASRVAVASAGVQFRLSCRTCSLHVDGVAVAGGLVLRDSSGFTPQTATQLSGCVLPARRLVPAAAGAGLQPVLPGSQQLLHLAVLFSVDTVADATFRLESRPCSVGAVANSSSSSSSSGGGENDRFVLVEAAGAGASALGLSAAAVATATASGTSSSSPGSSSPSYSRGMICSVTATLEPGEAEASGLGSAAAAGASSSRLLQRTVRLDASRLQQLAVAAAASGAAAAALAASAGGDGSSSNSSSNSNSSSANVTELEMTARAVQGARGIGVADLAPDWVADLPASTLYGFSCGCFWNGSWFGNVSAGLRPGSSGSAALYLAGWPVGLGPGQQGLLQLMYGPSDVAISSYSSWQQQRQLAAGSSSADPLGWESAGGAAAAGAAAGWGYRLSRHGGDAGQFDLGEVNGAAVRGVPEPLIGLDGSVGGGGGRMHQLLVLQGEGLPGHGEVVLLAATQPPPPPPLVEEPEYYTDASSGSGDGAGEEGGGAEEEASRPLVPVVQGWLPGLWEAWVPAEPAAAVPAT